MRINEAVTIALEKNQFIYRESEKENGLDFRVLPTNDLLDCCLVYSPEKEKFSGRWNPTASDLIAEDWNVFIPN